MVIFNSSFMIEREREKELLGWLRCELAGLGLAGVSGARVTAMREANGVDYREAEGQTVAFQLEFSSIEEARKWGSEVFAPLAARFERGFGPQAFVFTSIFEVV